MVQDSETRQLAAIVFTDLVGFTALMEADEAHARQILQSQRRLVQSLVGHYGGRLLKEIGDGQLLMFGSGVNAIRCAVAIQKADKDFALRIGIHIGDVVIEDEEIYGSGVNIASRIESLAPPGGICLTADVWHQTRNQTDLHATRLGHRELKGISLPVELYMLQPGQQEPAMTDSGSEATKTAIPAIFSRTGKRKLLAKKLGVIVIVSLVIAIGFVTLDRLVLEPRQASMPQAVVSDRIDSIAVLPFEDFTPGGDRAYLGTGIADTILHSLAQIEGLKVAARTSSFQLHEQNAGIPTIGQRLGVGAVLEGSVQVYGDRLRIIAQLVRVSDQSHLWSDTYESTTEDIFATQDAIAQSVATALHGDDAPGLNAQERTSPEVFELVAKGRHLWQQRNPADTAAAVSALERAVELDPDYAPAHAELAAAHFFNHLYGTAERAPAIEAARTAAERALELDDSLSQPWAVRGLIADDPEEAISAHERALERNPNNAYAMAWLSSELKALGQFNESQRMIERAYRLDPIDTYVRGAYARALMIDDDPASHQRAVEIVEETLRLKPGAFRAITDAANVNQRVGDLIKAANHYVTGLRRHPNSIALHHGLIRVLFMAGERDALLRWGASMDTLLPDEYKGTEWKYLIHDHDSFLANRRAKHAQQPDNPSRIAEVALGLALTGRYRESIEWHERALDAFRAARFHDTPITNELRVRYRLIWLYEHAGQAERAAALREETGPLFETVERNGINSLFVFFPVHRLIALGDLDSAVTALRGLNHINWKYFAFNWQNAPWWDEFKRRDDVREILQAWREEQDRLGARLRAEAPPVVFDPSLL